MTKPYRVPKKYYLPLANVATVGTVALLWHRSYTGVLYAIDADNIAARKCGKTWLVSVPSVVAYWGLPNHPTASIQPTENTPTAKQIEGQNGYRGSQSGR